MKTYRFDNIEAIKEVQLFDDSSGVLMTPAGALHKFNGSNTAPLTAPENIHVSDFYFISENKGAVIGHNAGSIQKGAFDVAAGSWLLLAVLIFGMWKLKHRFGYLKHFKVGLVSLVVLTFVGFGFSCNQDWKQHKEQDPDSPFTTIIKTFPLSTGFHHFGGNTGLKSFIAITGDGGGSWASYDINSNFRLTDIIGIGGNYFVSNYAADNHADGDLWIFGNDSTLSKRLKANDNNNPYNFTAGRGISGLKHDPGKGILYLYGSEKITKFPKDENSSTDGNIIAIKTNLMPNYKIIDVPGEVVVRSFAIANTGRMFVTLDNNKLLKTDGKKWGEVTIKDTKAFRQVEFEPGGKTGLALSTEGNVYQSMDGGMTWDMLNFSDIKKIKIPGSYALLIRNNKVTVIST